MRQSSHVFFTSAAIPAIRARTAVGWAAIAAAALPLASASAQRTLLRESFETPSRVRWAHTWGSAEVTNERAHAGERSLKCSVENKYGMSVHHCDFRARAGATYVLAAWLFVPKQEKECFPVLRLSDVGWKSLAEEAPGTKIDEWVQLQCQWKNDAGQSQIRVSLHNAPWKEGLEGAVYYWDDITLTEEGGAVEQPGARGRNPNVIEGAAVTPAGGMKVSVAAGKVRVFGKAVEVVPLTLEVPPERVLQIHDEQLRLTEEEPQGYGKGTALQHCLGTGVSLCGCLEPGSIVVAEKAGQQGRRYEQGKDWRADEDWGRIGRLPDGALGADQTVFVSYRIRLIRVDTICVDTTGRAYLGQGDDQKFCPEIPPVDYGSRGLCNVYLPYGCTEITAKELYPIGEPLPEPDVDFLDAHRARVAKTREKLERGDSVTIVTWGDSVTAGGDATRPEFRFPDAFAQALRYKYPQARVNLVNAGRGGWNSNRSLPLFEDDVLKHKPDLVTIEYVNDMGMSEENLQKNYFEAIDRLRAIGAEVAIITPHFTRPSWRGFAGVETPETRPAVGYLRKIAEEKQVALADASKRWEHLAAEGIPYYVLLRNGINHPNDAGHQLFVDELMRLF